MSDEPGEDEPGEDELTDGWVDINFPVPEADRPFDPEPARETARSRLAMGSFSLLVVVVLVILGVIATGTRTWDEMEGVAAVLLPAVLGIVGSILGYYFGSNKKG